MFKRNVSNQESSQVDVGSDKKNGKILFLLVILLLVAMVGFVWSFSSYRNYKKQVSFLSTPEGQQDLAKKEMDVLLAKVGRHIILPNDEQPTVASIVDPETLVKDQPFYKGAQKGDKILIFVKAQKAIVYNEANDIIVNVGPVYLENKEQTAVAPVQPIDDKVIDEMVDSVSEEEVVVPTDKE